MAQTQTRNNIATIFFKLFVKSLINQTRTAKQYRFQNEIPLIKEINTMGNFVIEDEEKLEFKNYLLEEIPSPIKERETDFLASTPAPPPKSKIIKEIEPLPELEVEEEPKRMEISKFKPTQIQTPESMTPPQQSPQPFQPQHPQQIPGRPQPRFPTPPSQQPQIEAGLDKINQILSDPAVQSIECQGPDKSLLINKGKVEPSPIKLSKEEVKKVTNFFSEQTHIPLVTGVFKAVLGNLNMTAVVSDFVGTRFIIQKRPPQMQSPMRR